jgi:lipopolysaccharide assembly outer membrane protein LptD (OstA)
VHLENTRKIKQVYFDSGYQYDDYWNFGLGTRVDVTQSKPRQLTRSIRVTYTGDCVSISSTVSRDFTSDSSRAIKKTDDWSFAIGLKTLNM